ncbi:hypothetical protein [uncultured Desulfobacter sp.]|uniref:hypothetical protein n=1 Tax=uncultured Desulfobacter sp. TaxID=240139 RepID=UPI0029F47487|nr:hypothetical protein [uncultured Desulfobacter sp.]
MINLIAACTHTLDALKRFWHLETTYKTASNILILIFLTSLILIEFNRQGMLPKMLATHISHSHFTAIYIAFLLVLYMEIISMIFTLPESMSRALGKQFEILALIFLRNAFKQLSDLTEPLSLTHHQDVVYHIFAYGFGALAIFGLLGCYRIVLTKPDKRDKTILTGPCLNRFISAKKTMAFCILLIFFGMGVLDLWLISQKLNGFDFLQSFYTVLIFSDILMVFLAQGVLPQFQAVFRNSGYALATLLMRLSLTTSVYYSVSIGLSAMVFALLLTIIYNKFYSRLHE